jgi:threonine dehydratase
MSKKSFIVIDPLEIAIAHNRILPYIHRTPLLKSEILNDFLGHEIVFKAECLQKIGAFKIRGALNTLLALKEKNSLPKSVVAFSSGNHAQAVAMAGKLLGIETTIVMPSSVSSVKQQATSYYGAKIINTSTRKEAEEKAAEIEEAGSFFIHPFDNDSEIVGQGTACYEALQDGVNPDAIFATCGGGGLLSGTFLAKELLAPNALVFGAEPSQANDASLSYAAKKIISFDDSPSTIADGARASSVSDRTFYYLQQLDGFFEISEEKIIYWTQWLMHLLKITVEPTSAVAMAAAFEWLKTQKTKQKILVILSGGNISPETYQKIWQKNYLEHPSDNLLISDLHYLKSKNE